MPLTALERAVLEFERDWPVMTERARKRDTVRSRIGISITRYYRVLARMVDSTDALSQDPLTVRRLRRRRDDRRRAVFVTEPPRQRRPR